MTWALQFLLCIVFLELFLVVGLGREATNIITRSRAAARVFIDASLDDDHKETFMQRESIEMLKATGRLVLKIAAIGAILYAVYFLIVTIVPESRDEIVAGFTSITTISILTVATLAYAWARHVIGKKL